MSIPIVIIILLAILLVAWGVCRFAARAGAAPLAPATRQAWGSDSEVRLLLQRGQKIEAIKLLVADRRLGLKEAKDAVEALERGGVLPALGAGATLRVLAPAALAEITTLAAAGKQIDAVRRYRELTSADLKTSKAAVEALRATR